MGRGETHEISEYLRQVGGGATHPAGALEPELLEAGPEGGWLEAERRGGTGWTADPPTGLDARSPIFRSLSEESCGFGVSLPWIFTAGSIQLLDSAGPRPHRAPDP